MNKEDKKVAKHFDRYIVNSIHYDVQSLTIAQADFLRGYIVCVARQARLDELIKLKNKNE